MPIALRAKIRWLELKVRLAAAVVPRGGAVFTRLREEGVGLVGEIEAWERKHEEA